MSEQIELLSNPQSWQLNREVQSTERGLWSSTDAQIPSPAEGKALTPPSKPLN